MLRFLYTAIGLLIWLESSQGQEAKKVSKWEKGIVKVEIRGGLWIDGELVKLPKLESAMKDSHAYLRPMEESDATTKARIVTSQMGPVEIYFGDDKELQELAKKLNKQTVVLTGEMTTIHYLFKSHGGYPYQWPYPVFGYQAHQQPPETARFVARKNVIRVTALKAAEDQ